MTKQSRRKFAADFKSKVVIKARKEHSTIEELSKSLRFILPYLNLVDNDILARARLWVDAGYNNQTAAALNKLKRLDKMYNPAGL